MLQMCCRIRIPAVSNRYISKWPDVLPTGGAKDSALKGAKSIGNRLRGGTAAALPLRLGSWLERRYRQNDLRLTDACAAEVRLFGLGSDAPGLSGRGWVVRHSLQNCRDIAIFFRKHRHKKQQSLLSRFCHVHQNGTALCVWLWAGPSLPTAIFFILWIFADFLYLTPFVSIGIGRPRPGSTVCCRF